MGRVRQLLALLFRPDAGQAAGAVAQAQLAVVVAVGVDGALALALEVLGPDGKVVPGRAVFLPGHAALLLLGPEHHVGVVAPAVAEHDVGEALVPLPAVG